ncbi:MAG: hypothetical protein AB1413_07900 [Thermodesulfobacteriota bacterium]
MIEFKPITSSARLLSATGDKPDLWLFSGSTKQILFFYVKFSQKRGHETMRLATGELMENLKGFVRLRRGVDSNEKGERIVDTLQYNPPSNGDEDNPEPSPSSFSIELFVDEILFDQIVNLSHTVGLPTINLQFDYQRGMVTFGAAPDGSEITWNNNPRLWEKIEGATFTHILSPPLTRAD